MTYDDGFDRTVSDWLDEQAGHGMPGYLDEILTRTTRTRQRPAWSSLERWLPVQTTLRLVPAPRIAWLLVVLGLILAIVAAALWIGSRQRLPQPFGPARNGAILSSHDGDIFAVDPVTHTERLLVGGTPFDFGPTFSRDGTKVLFLRGSGDPADVQGHNLMVANVDGTAIHELTPKTPIDWVDWSPDGRQIAFQSRKTGRAPGILNVVNVDGSGLITLDVGRPAQSVSWLPPLGHEIVFRSEQNTQMEAPPAIWAVHPDGTGLRTLSARPAMNEYDYQNPAVAPDGSRLSYWSADLGVRIHILDLRTGVDATLPAPDGIEEQWGSAYFSPDGHLVGYMRNYPDHTSQFVIAPVDGSGTGTPVGLRQPNSGVDVNWTWTPDGSAVVVDYGGDGTVHLLPIDGSPGTLLGKGDMAFADIQRLAP